MAFAAKRGYEDECFDVIDIPFLRQRLVREDGGPVSRTLVLQARLGCGLLPRRGRDREDCRKRLAGQTGTFDLVVLIQLATVLQRMALGDSPAEGLRSWRR